MCRLNVALLHRCACGLSNTTIGALPTFAYRPPDDGDGGIGKSRGSAVLCAVRLEDVQTGEIVRQLPACNHLFHADCGSAWLRAHRTCALPLRAHHAVERHSGEGLGHSCNRVLLRRRDAAGVIVDP
ncbi:hypothetical protein EJB05_42103, partial [Eragrostis curvula]